VWCVSFFCLLVYRFLQQELQTAKDRRKAVGGTKTEAPANLKKHEKTPEQRNFLKKVKACGCGNDSVIWLV